ncbi:EndoU domain-containing protein [Bifidobacterium simiarum]|uniref:Transposase n=1 Tax=Bifidobacterium simiarum TaxID=2045441 RepID=A0A2M9HCN3_9BIFI|nr:EndoU domain-containing protein [Bifidobacterium simiarum]MBT1166149.1 EndoU domain-containing protein [Bifidobacterium simiarum]PJM74561.1 transposase [Bifidobacterium simiarum]
MGTGESGIYYTSDGSKRVHHQALIHSIEGVFTHNPRTGRIQKMKSGGHGQANLDLLDNLGIRYVIDETFSNGVRKGHVEGHYAKKKREREGQLWFPRNWTTRDIVKAGEHVSGLKSNRNRPEGIIWWGTYKGVRVGIIKRNGQVQTIFPAENQPRTKGKR